MNPLHDPSDDELVSRYLNDDRHAFETLYLRHHGKVYNYARALLRNESSAEDAMQDAFVRASTALSNYRMQGKFVSWLLSITRNRCFNILNRRHRSDVPLDTGSSETRSTTPGPVELLEREEDARRIEDAVKDLPERQREVLVLFAFKELSYRDIAEVLDVPVNTVKTLIFRARQTLTESLNLKE